MVVQLNSGDLSKVDTLDKFSLSMKGALATSMLLISGLSIASYSENNLPLCYIQFSNGKIVNLNSICGKKAPELQRTQRFDYLSDLSPNYAPTPAPAPPTFKDMISPVSTPYPYDTNLDSQP